MAATATDTRATRPGAVDRAALGRAARDRTPLSGLAGHRRGDGDEFERAMSKFAATYVDQNLEDHRGFRGAIEQGRIDAASGL